MKEFKKEQPCREVVDLGRDEHSFSGKIRPRLENERSDIGSAGVFKKLNPGKRRSHGDTYRLGPHGVLWTRSKV